MSPLFVALFAALVLLCLLAVGYVWLLDRHEAERKAWIEATSSDDSSVPTIAQLTPGLSTASVLTPASVAGRPPS